MAISDFFPSTRVKKIFSSSKILGDKPVDASSSDSDVIMDSTTPTKPQRKGGKLRKSNERIPEKINSDTAEVHGQSFSKVRKSQDPENVDTELPQHLGTSHNQLTEIAQLTIRNERLCKENELLRQKNLELATRNTITVENTNPPLRFHRGHKAREPETSDDPPTVERLLLDRELLENLVWRLNVELGRYETRLQQFEKKLVPEKIQFASEKSKSPAPAWCRADPSTLGPLFEAYDEALLEKSHLISNFEHQMHKLGAELREVVSENDRLHEALDELLKKESEAREENEMMQKDINNLHCENVILLEKLEAEKAKNEDLSEDYASKLSKIQEQEALIIQKEVDIKTLAREYGILEQQFVQAKFEIEKRVPVKHHEDAIADCRKLLEQLKKSYNEDRQLLEEQNKTLLVEKVAAETKIRGLNAEIAQNEARIHALEKLLRRTETRSEQLQMKLVGAESCRDSSVRELRQLMAVTEQLTADQEMLLHQLQLYQGTSRRLSALRSSLKLVQKELPEIERQLKAQENGVERLRGDHQREMTRLQSLLLHKDQSIKQLQQERNSTCEQLEVVWRAAGFESLPNVANKLISEPQSLPETHRRISPRDD